MAFSPVSWSYRDIFTSAKAAQMVENLRTHDHYSSGQGANLGARATATGIATVGPVAANGTADVVVTFPAGRFSTPPKAIATLESRALGRYANVKPGVTTASGTVIRVVAGPAAGGMTLAATPIHWIAVES